MSRLALLLALVAATLVPFAPRSAALHRDGPDFPGWPDQYEGVTLTPLAPGPQDAWFARDFPGRVARFAARDRQVVVRWVNAPTRRLHPASHCFEGAGYAIEPRVMARTSDGALASCFGARRGDERLKVCEQLRATSGESFPDVSSWYWHALAAPAGSAWWSYVVVEREAGGDKPAH